MKKNRILPLAFIAAGILAFTACKKEDPTPNTGSGSGSGSGGTTVEGDNEALYQFFADNLEDAKQSFVIDAESNATITGNQGMILNFYANSFETQTGVAVTGNVDITLIEIHSKADMVLMNMPTDAYDASGNIVPLVSGGELKVTATQNGQALKLKSGASFQAEIPAPNGTNPEMKIFYGQGSSDTVVWAESDSSLVFGQGNSYFMYCDSINWVNLDYFYSDPRPLTKVKVVPATGFATSNSLQFVIAKGLNIVSNLGANIDNQFETLNGYKLPEGLEVHFLALAIVNDEIQYKITSNTIVNGHLENTGELTVISKEGLKAAIEALP